MPSKQFALVLLLVALVMLVACTPATLTPAAPPTPMPAAPTTEPEPTEAAMVTTTDTMSIPVVQPVLETHPIVDMDADEAPADARLGDADDPAIWLHPADPAQSFVVGVLKEGGLEVYDLDGQVIQSIAPSDDDNIRYNNIDLAYNFPLGEKMVDIVVASDRYEDKLAIYQVNPDTRQLEDISDPANALLFTPPGQESDEETTAYGLALYHSPKTGKFYAFVSRRDTSEAAQFELTDNGSGQISVTQVRYFTLPVPEAEGDEEVSPQIEGTVADQELGVVYMGQEDVGIWKFGAEPEDSPDGTLIHAIADPASHLSPDVEGLTIYYADSGTGYLMASSQGDNTFVVYTREGDNSYLGSFQVGANGDIDGSEECDGAMILNVPLGDQYPNGLLVVQDGGNDPTVMVEDDGEMENAATNFKYVPWERVANGFATPLKIDTTSYSPR